MRSILPAATVFLFLSGLVSAQTPLGTEFQVNAYTTDMQWAPSVAVQPGGDFVIVWQSAQQDGSAWGIFGQRYSRRGSAMGSEFQVNTYTTGNQLYGQLGMDSSGNFVVVWVSVHQDGDEGGIFGQRYRGDGARLGGEFAVNAYTTGFQNNPSIAVSPNGKFAVVWDRQDGYGLGVFGRRFSSSGAPLGSEFIVNSYTTSHQTSPALAVDESGNLVVVWQSSGQDGSLSGIFGRRFGSDGTPLGTELQLNMFTDNNQAMPAVAMRADGSFVVTWNSYSQDGHGYGVFARRFGSHGIPVAPEFQVNTYTTGSQSLPAVAMEDSGDFVIVWNRQDGSGSGIWGQRYSGDGSRVGVEFQVNTYTSGSQRSFMQSNIAMDTEGDFVVTWQSDGQDGSSDGIFAQRYLGRVKDCNNPHNPFLNCGFESGDFSGWVTQDLAVPLDPLQVTKTFFFLGPATPTEGSFAVRHGFDGGFPATISVGQDVSLPEGPGILEFDYRARWSNSGALDRTFQVSIQPPGGGRAFEATRVLTAASGTSNQDTGPQIGSVDVSAFSGQTVRISFDWNVPEIFTGPGSFQLDNVQVRSRLDLDCSANLLVGLCSLQDWQSMGETLYLGAVVDNEVSSPSGTQPHLGIPDEVDFYLGALLPDGNTIVYFTDLAFHFAEGSLSDLSSIGPIAASVDLSSPFYFSEPNLFSHHWQGLEQVGTYLFFFAAVKPGAFADGVANPGDLVDLSTVAITFLG